MRLGDERISVSLNVAEGVGILFDTYREGMLLDRYLETVALKYDLSFEEAKLIFYLSQADEGCTLGEMSEVTRIRKRKLETVIQKLISKEYIKQKKKSVNLEFEILSNAESIIIDLLTAKNTYQQVKYAGFSEEEIEQYEVLSARVRENVQKALK